MTKRYWTITHGCWVAGVVLTAAGEAQAAPKLRYQNSQVGDVVLIGNTLGQECANGTPPPVVGTVGACGLSTDDSTPDLFWRSDSPQPGQATADLLTTAAQARSTAVLAIPPAAQITRAFVYWGATRSTAGTDPAVTLDRQGGFSVDLTADECFQSANNSYHCVADVTATVQDEGEGAYRMSGLEVAPLANVNNSNLFAGWWMAVFYDDSNGTLRNLALFDGLDPVSNGNPQNTMLSGFLVPNNGYTAKLGVVAFEGDNTLVGDQFLFNGTAITNAINPANNFFNGSRSTLGVATSVAGDLPQLTGTAQSMSGIDIDVVNVTANVMGGQTSAMIQGTSSGDTYYLAGFVTSISDYRPNFATSTKTVTDLNGGSALPGDVLEYELVAINTGNDVAINVVLTDPLPAQVTYVPGTLEITAGANTGMKTDAAADDQGEFAGGVVTFRLGTGADGSQGGSIPVGQSATMKFQVTINDDAMGTIENQATINAAGEQGAPPTDTPTDGNGGDMGAPSTDILIEECGDDSMCAMGTPICDTSKTPNKCVECVEDADCGALEPTCDPVDNACTCIASGDEVCDGADNDCNGEADEGFGAGDACSSGVGACAVDGVLVCDGLDSVKCDAEPGAPSDEVCDGLDNDCNGEADEGFGVGESCIVGVGECENEGVAFCDIDGLGCDGAPLPAGVEVCGDELDSDCDGANSNGCQCDEDSDCGASDSGQVCDASVCIAGCRGVGGNGCPSGEVCSSDDESVGVCQPEASSDTEDPTLPTTGLSETEGDTGGIGDTDVNPSTPTASSVPTDGGSDSDSASNPSGNSGELDDEGFGCECNSNNSSGAPAGLALLTLLAAGRRRRRA